MNRISKFLNKKMIEYLCISYSIYNYTINSDLSVSVNGDVTLTPQTSSSRVLKTLPFQFNVVSGSFACAENNLTSLKGSPKIVGNFDCEYNNITDLEGSPEVVNGWFSIVGNRIKSFKGGPKTVKGDIICSTNLIRDIYDIPKFGGYLYTYCNPVHYLLTPYPDNSKRFTDRPDKNDWINFFNDCDIIRDDHIIWDRLVFFYDYLDIEIGQIWEDDIKIFYKIIK